MVVLINVDTRKKRALNEFIRSQNVFYPDNKNFIPHIPKELIEFFSVNNPMWTHIKKQLFVIKEDNFASSQVLARVAVFLDKDYINYSGEKVGYFGFYECVNDITVALKLDKAICTWMRKYGVKKIRGPINASIMDEMGFLIGGFESPPVISMPYSNEYYIKLMKSLGYKKAKDLYAYLIKIEKFKKVFAEHNEQFFRDKINLSHNVTVTPIRKGMGFEEDAVAILDVINDAFKGNNYWQYSPIHSEDFKYKMRLLKPLINQNFVYLARINKEVVGFVFAYQDFNQSLKGLDGNLGLNHPLNTIRFLWRTHFTLNKSKLSLICVKKDFEHYGVGKLLTKELINNMPREIKSMEYSWVYEDNLASIKLAKRVGGKLYKIYRIYEKII